MSYLRIFDALVWSVRKSCSPGSDYGTAVLDRVIDHGFSRQGRSFEKWGHTVSPMRSELSYDRPLVITSVFVGGRTDGHGNHQVAGQMAQEVFKAAGDPNMFPEQIKEGLRPWKPLKD